MESSSNYCFCTIAIGDIYRRFAVDLIGDLQQSAPHSQILVFTDRPSDFSNYPNCLPHKHFPQSIHVYFDKAIAIAQALKRYENCIFLDADIRITAPVPATIAFGNGIKAYSCFSLRKLYTSGFHGQKPSPKKASQWALIERAAQKIEADLDTAKFIWEYCFFVHRHPQIFAMLETWQQLGRLYELAGRVGGEGEALGLAASAHQVPVDYDDDKVLSFFKNRVELWKISEGRSTYADMENYFSRYKMIKYPKQSILLRGFRKLSARSRITYRKMRLIAHSFSDIEFYYR
jgi:hypothetical protein